MVGTGKTVTLSSSYSGSDVSNYSVTDQSSTTANITAKALTVSGITASNKSYDGATSATLSTSSILYSGLVSGDSFSGSYTGTFDNKMWEQENCHNIFILFRRWCVKLFCNKSI